MRCGHGDPRSCRGLLSDFMWGAIDRMTPARVIRAYRTTSGSGESEHGSPMRCATTLPRSNVLCSSSAPSQLDVDTSLLCCGYLAISASGAPTPMVYSETTLSARHQMGSAHVVILDGH